MFCLQGGRIQAWIPEQQLHLFENQLIEGQTYDVHHFVVRQYAEMQIRRCCTNANYIQFNHMTELSVTGGVDHIPPHIFDFTGLSALMEAASEQKFLIGECLKERSLFIVYSN